VLLTAFDNYFVNKILSPSKHTVEYQVNSLVNCFNFLSHWQELGLKAVRNRIMVIVMLDG